MRSIISDSVRVLAFDLDGTLYDEYDFVRQAYWPVSRVMAETSGADENELYRSLCSLWLSYGSSANIFQMAYEGYGKETMDEDLLRKCIREYRGAEFELALSQRTEDFLNMCRNYEKVIITDGNSDLQRRKYRALKLDRWIDENSLFVSGDYGRQFSKPDPYMGELVKEKTGTDQILYFGDREIDKEFAENAGFCFQQVRNMMFV